MGGKGGGGDDGSQKIVEQQKKDAEVAAIREAKRQQELDSGVYRINEIFDGGPSTTGYGFAHDLVDRDALRGYHNQISPAFWNGMPGTGTASELAAYVNDANVSHGGYSLGAEFVNPAEYAGWQEANARWARDNVGKNLGATGSLTPVYGGQSGVLAGIPTSGNQGQLMSAERDGPSLLGGTGQNRNRGGSLLNTGPVPSSINEGSIQGFDNPTRQQPRSGLNLRGGGQTITGYTDEAGNSYTVDQYNSAGGGKGGGSPSSASGGKANSKTPTRTETTDQLVYTIRDAQGNVVGVTNNTSDLRAGNLWWNPKYNRYGANQGGFGGGFYDKYGNAYLDYYNPQVWDQYDAANEKLTFDAARAGTINSSAVIDNQADYYGQLLDNQASIKSQADQAVGDLRNQVSNAKSSAVNQLYATENPDLAAANAAGVAANLRNATPKLDPLGQIFQTASLGAANYLRGAQDYSQVPGSSAATTSKTRIYT